MQAPKNTRSRAKTAIPNTSGGNGGRGGRSRSRSPDKKHHPWNGRDIVSVMLFILMVLMAILSYLFGPDRNGYNTSDAGQTAGGNTTEIVTVHRFFDLPPATLSIVYVIANICWLVFFIAFALCGPWANVEDFQRQCHRALCVGSLLALFLLKVVAPDQIAFSYCPAGITALVEGSYLVIAIVFRLCRVLGNCIVMIWETLKKWFRLTIRIGRE